MFEFLRSRLAPGKAPARSRGPRVPDGERVYAVGDIHGRSDLFSAMIDAIEHDFAEAGEGVTSTVILLGDLVDRGPDSAGVLWLARKWGKRRPVRVLAGNHEEMMLKSFEDTDVLKHFLRHGGRETLLSYGVDRKAFTKASIEEVRALLAEHVPAKDRRFIEGFEDMVRIGDYVFVHAGIEPGVPLDEQKTRTLRWIREPFLSHAGAHEGMVVHGHTITEGVEATSNRIGIDTGAYASGRLTALVLEGAERRLISVVEGKKGVFAVENSALPA
ncbi:metallophosphoesterase family protein [Aurantiacibacter luteus]|uniref:Serine/threonine protein phosphatase n=1 Tax=Aurantiacibacter luteus TaxID=1581420 RepID=A0A0G9MSX0_9SPHN|nr:metallophosphoesterase family protein [Aurantiacibacter luteus]KLE32418.1 serine/threonine protein phosphatase [Aurantiacibacter luteus]